MSELNEKIENAIAAYLKQYVDGDLTIVPAGTDVPSSFYWPPSLQYNDKSYRILTGESEMDKNGQAILVIAGDAEREHPQFTGNFFVPVEIWLRTPVKVLSPQEIANRVPDSLDFHKAAATVLEHAILQESFLLASYFTQSGSDITFYTVLDRQPQRQQVANFWASGWTFRVYVMGRTAP